MYDFIEGIIEELAPTHAVVNCSGVGYMINISLNTYEKIRGQQNIRLRVHQVVKEDSHTLFGFAHDDERQIFRHLISISGIGAATSRMILSSLTEKEVVQAIMSENVPLLKSVKGIGPKAAQRIVLELKIKWEGVHRRVQRGYRQAVRHQTGRKHWMPCWHLVLTGNRPKKYCQKLVRTLALMPIQRL